MTVNENGCVYPQEGMEGQIWHDAYWNEDYEILSGDNNLWSFRWADGHITNHCTPINVGDKRKYRRDIRIS